METGAAALALVAAMAEVEAPTAAAACSQTGRLSPLRYNTYEKNVASDTPALNPDGRREELTSASSENKRRSHEGDTGRGTGLETKLSTNVDISLRSL